MSTAAICAACGQNVWVGSENRCTSCGTANSLAGFYDVEQTYVPAVATLGTIAGSQRTRPGLMLAGALTAITGAMISATGVGIIIGVPMALAGGVMFGRGATRRVRTR
jgi:hypothetical protein